MKYTGNVSAALLGLGFLVANGCRSDDKSSDDGYASAGAGGSVGGSESTDPDHTSGGQSGSAGSGESDEGPDSDAGRGGSAGAQSSTAGDGGTAGAAGGQEICAEFAASQAVPLWNASATFSQASFGGNPVGAAIDGQILENNGWSIYEGTDADGPNLPGKTHAQTAVFETVADAGSVGTSLTIKLEQWHSLNGHSLGRFRISVTADARSEFADGAPANGDVTANWKPLLPISASATGGVTLVIMPDQSILASGATPAETSYTVTAAAPFAAITGFRLEALEDASLPDSGPGRYSNGNFVLSEFAVEQRDCVSFH